MARRSNIVGKENPCTENKGVSLSKVRETSIASITELVVEIILHHYPVVIK